MKGMAERRLAAPSRLASATCGLPTGRCGLVNPGAEPRTDGCEWHWAQLLPLKVGPRPAPPFGPSVSLPETESTSWNRTIALRQNARSSGARPGMHALAFGSGQLPPGLAAVAFGVLAGTGTHCGLVVARAGKTTAPGGPVRTPGSVATVTAVPATLAL